MTQSAMVNRPTPAQTKVLGAHADGGSGGSGPGWSRSYASCRSAGWIREGALTVTGKAALEAGPPQFALSGQELETLVRLLSGPLYWHTGGKWSISSGTLLPGEWAAGTLTTSKLFRRGMIDGPVSPPPGDAVRITAKGLDALGVVPPVPMGSGETYREGSGAKVYAWTGTPPPGWRPGLAAPFVPMGLGEMPFDRENDADPPDPVGDGHATKHANNSEPAKRIRLDFAPGEHCHASHKDGECNWSRCPQERNGRVDYQSWCPLAIDEDE